MKKLLLFFLVCGLAVFVYLGWHGIRFMTTPPSQEKAEVVFEIPPGTAFYTAAIDLEAQGLITDSRLFRVYGKLTGQTTQLKVGEYRLYKNMLPREILNELVGGKSIAYTLTVPEGHNINDIRQSLNSLWLGRGDEFFGLVTDPAFVKSIMGQSRSSLEGYLFPDTYLVTKYTTMRELIGQMYDRFQKEISEVNKARRIQMDLHKQVILASVIEKETGAPEERQLISSVFHNRLKKGMRLQSDPTILYGIFVQTKEMKKNISKADILAPTPYNTYTVPALPAGPIANPGRDALFAAVNPVDSEYLYFVSRNDGTHVFSESYEKHDKAVKNYQLNRKSREGKSWRDLKKRESKTK